MYTGIVTHKKPITSLEEKPDLRRFGIVFSDDLLNGLSTGASVSVAGVCLTVSAIEKSTVYFDAMIETLRKTTLGLVHQGDMVNIERSAKMGDEVGGHQMAGHVYGMANIVERKEIGDTLVFTFQVPLLWMKYLLEKGFVGLDGVSLTITNARVQEGTFDVYLIPETVRITTFGEKQVGDRVNVEIDHMTQTIVDTVERMVTP